MNKLANMRHWSERMGPNFGMSRPNMPMNPNPMNPPRRDHIPPPTAAMPMPQPLDLPTNGIVHYALNVPFSSDLAGPNTEDILHATKDAVLRWTHSVDAPDDVPVYELPVHAQNLANLRKTCKDITDGPFNIEAHVISTTPKNAKGNQVTTVCLSGTQEMVQKTREMILNDHQTFLVCILTPLHFLTLSLSFSFSLALSFVSFSSGNLFMLTLIPPAMHHGRRRGQPHL